MTERPDPTGYAITYDRDGFHVLTRLVDKSEVGRYPSRDEACEAADDDREQPDPNAP